MSPPEIEFAAPVLRQQTGARFHYVLLPPELADAWQAEGVRRLCGTLNGHPVNRALQQDRDGQRFLVVGLELLRQIHAAVGDIVMAALCPDPEPDRVVLPDELVAALAEDAEAGARFYAFTPGRQRSVAYYVESARRAETRESRALELAHKLRTHTLYGDLHPDKP